jgi:hypothetical protein
MQFLGPAKGPAGAVFDTAFSHIDDALGMALLFGLEGKKDLRVVSTSVSRANLKAAIYCDIVGRFYAGAVSGAIGFGGRTLPVGMPWKSTLTSDEAFFTEPIKKPAYATDIKRPEDTADANVVMRNALTSQYDDNALILVTGPLTNAADLLELGGARDLIAHKVKVLVFYSDPFNLKADLPAAKKVLADWPTPIVAAGPELSQKILYPGSSIEKDFDWSKDHPVVDAYKANKPMPYDAPTGSMAAVLYAGRPQENYFKVSDPGTLSVQPDGTTKFAASAGGKHKYLIADPEQQDRIVRLYTELVSAKPVPRPQRIPQKPVGDKKPPERKPPAEAKPPA